MGSRSKQKKKAVGIPKTGQLRAKQIRESPDYPVQNLYPCKQGSDIAGVESINPDPYVFWLLNNLNLTEGVLFKTDGYISYAPAMVARMRITSFRVHVQLDGFHEECAYKLRMLYLSKDGEIFEQYSDSLYARDWDDFVFNIPLEHINPRGWFTCMLHISLLAPLPPGPERDTALRERLENPRMPVLLRGSYLEIRG